jgi:hypothetical protein
MSDPARPPDDVLAAFAIDRGSPIPLWFQVAQHLEQSIATGELPQGTLLDNEIVMAERLGVSRPTMRRAMEQLVDQGADRPPPWDRHPRGAAQGAPPARADQPPRRPLRLGQEPATEVLRFETMGANAEIAGRLRVEEGAPVVLVERLRSARRAARSPDDELAPGRRRHLRRGGAGHQPASTSCSAGPASTCTPRPRPSARDGDRGRGPPAR